MLPCQRARSNTINSNEKTSFASDWGIFERSQLTVLLDKTPPASPNNRRRIVFDGESESLYILSDYADFLHALAQLVNGGALSPHLIAGSPLLLSACASQVSFMAIFNASNCLLYEGHRRRTVPASDSENGSDTRTAASRSSVTTSRSPINRRPSRKRATSFQRRNTCEIGRRMAFAVVW
ncbi:hypothetical protein BDZ89DRAFT_278487 [Hymenopellis radicata]|nr:hypothetical protein BDZ89DRAFT_278487 [Hymenopellis radicata]